MSIRLSKTSTDGSSFTGTAQQTTLTTTYTGPQGDTGAAGADATLPSWTFATPTAIAAGGTPTLSVTGSYPTQSFTFGLVSGATGDDGEDGVDGSDGAAATIAVGSTTTGDAGTSASVANSGSSAAATFDFTIPKGATGDTGATGTGTPTGGDSGQVLQKSSGTDYDFAWTTISGTGTVTSIATSDSTFIDLTPDSAITGSGTISADLSATGTASSSTFLRGDNTWSTLPASGHDIKDESGDALTTRANMTFVGELVAATDNSSTTSTDITIDAKTAWLYG